MVNKSTRTLSAGAWIAIAAFAVFLGTAFEAANQGPYTRWFNHRLVERATAARLLGKPEADVERVLGRASSERDANSVLQSNVAAVTAGRGVSHVFRYFPYPWVTASAFSVQCEDGVVVAVRELED